ncbi:MAG: cobT [Rhodospirillales bacterium]|nr:cobT [Rhodospirillales bacterium]
MSTELDELRALPGALPDPDLESASAALTALATRGVGDEEARELVAWLAMWQRRRKPRLARPRIALFAAAHGLARDDLPYFRTEVRRAIAGEGPWVEECAAAEAELRLHEMSLNDPTPDIRVADALTPEATAHAMLYGMIAVEPGLDLLVVSAIGDGAEDASRVLETAIAGGADPMPALGARGGPDLAAVAGAILAARMAGTPVLLDGGGARAAAGALAKLDPRSVDHCRDAFPYAGGEARTGRMGARAIGALRAAASLLE